MQGFSLQQEIIKALISVIVAIVTLSFGWLVGHRLTAYWAIRQKRKELELSAVNEFYKLYGEFFAVWKLWAYYVHSAKELSIPETIRWELLQRASIAEGSLESIFVKLASEHRLPDRDIETLGRFRQAYQQLRESIRDNKDIGWFHQDHPEYLSFKRLAYLTGCIIVSDRRRRRRVREQMAHVLEQITSNRWETRWVLAEDDWNRLRSGKRRHSK